MLRNRLTFFIRLKCGTARADDIRPYVGAVRGRRGAADDCGRGKPLPYRFCLGAVPRLRRPTGGRPTAGDYQVRRKNAGMQLHTYVYISIPNTNTTQTQHRHSPDQIQSQSQKHREIHIQTQSHSQKESGAGLLKVLKTARFGFFTV